MTNEQKNIQDQNDRGAAVPTYILPENSHAILV